MNVDAVTPLHFACRHSSDPVKMVTLLIDLGVSVVSANEHMQERFGITLANLTYGADLEKARLMRALFQEIMLPFWENYQKGVRAKELVTQYEAQKKMFEAKEKESQLKPEECDAASEASAGAGILSFMKRAQAEAAESKSAAGATIEKTKTISAV